MLVTLERFRPPLCSFFPLGYVQAWIVDETLMWKKCHSALFHSFTLGYHIGTTRQKQHVITFLSGSSVGSFNTHDK